MASPFLSQKFTTPQAVWTAHSAVPAIVAGYPLLEAIRTCHVQTLLGVQASGHAPFNVFGHSLDRPGS